MKKKLFNEECSCTRRDFMRKGLYGMGISAAMPYIIGKASRAAAAEALLNEIEPNPNRIMVVVELNGGADGLNIVVPHGHDEYYKLRPRLALDKNTLHKIDDEFAFGEFSEGFHRLYQDGKMAIVHGCGYPGFNLSHFTAMEWWHTAVPHGADPLGWVGRTADSVCPETRKNYIVNIGTRETLAVRSGVHPPLIFNDPDRFVRIGDAEQKKVFSEMSRIQAAADNPELAFLQSIEQNAAEGSVLVREACSRYRTPIDYGVSGGGIGLDMRKVAALVDAGFPTRFYYVVTGGFDTHINQATTFNKLMGYVADAMRAFTEDMDRIGRGKDVAVMMFTEFGRRASDNAGGGTDHGTAGPMYIFGNQLKGGTYGKFPGLTDLDNGNLKMTTDFRRVYATMINEWMGYEDTKTLLKGDFPTLGVFA